LYLGYITLDFDTQIPVDDHLTQKLTEL